MHLSDSVKMKLFTWQGRLWRSGGGGRQTGVGGEMDGNAEMDGVTHSFKGLGYKGEERHQVVVGEEYGVEGGFIFKMEDDVEM